MPAFDHFLYAGSAPHYPSGRLPYPSTLADALRAELGLDGTGWLLDVGCGPGSLTTLLAPHFAAATGIDADQDMIAVARTAAPALDWRCLRAEEIPADLGTFQVITFAQSFHWMDRDLVARRLRPMIAPGGAWVHVAALTHRGTPTGDRQPGSPGGDPLPEPPWAQIDELIVSYLGPIRRAGKGLLPHGTAGGEEDIMREAGYAGPTRLTVPGGTPTERSTDAVVSSVYSLSSSAPHLFGPHLGEFEKNLRSLLSKASPTGTFTEQQGPVEAVIWRP